MKHDDVKRIRLYSILAGLWLLLWAISFVNYDDTFGIRILNEFWVALVIVPANFIFYEYAVTFILRRRKHVAYNLAIALVLIFVFLVVLSFGLYAWVMLGKKFEIYTQLRFSVLSPDGPIYRMVDETFYHARTGIASIVFFGIAKLIHYNFSLRELAQQMRLEKQESELNFLKSQTNPHFLFNTLNNIYALAKDKSDLAAESILQLSKILRFMLYETSTRFIGIDKELSVISDYIALEKLRYDDSLRIDLTSNVQDDAPQIPPLLLIPLVENAFKHGASESDGDAFIAIRLTVHDDELQFTVSNSAANDGTAIRENIGLANLRRQLELLYYDYDLSVKKQDGMFTAVLKINLASHV